MREWRPRQGSNLHPSASKADALSIELRGRHCVQGHAGRTSCVKVDPGLFKDVTDYPRVGNRDRRLPIDALGTRKRLDTKLAGTSQTSSVPTQQTPGCSDLQARDHIRTPRAYLPESNLQRLRLRKRRNSRGSRR